MKTIGILSIITKYYFPVLLFPRYWYYLTHTLILIENYQSVRQPEIWPQLTFQNRIDFTMASDQSPTQIRLRGSPWQIPKGNLMTRKLFPQEIGTLEVKRNPWLIFKQSLTEFNRSYIVAPLFGSPCAKEDCPFIGDIDFREYFLRKSSLWKRGNVRNVR